MSSIEFLTSFQTIYSINFVKSYMLGSHIYSKKEKINFYELLPFRLSSLQNFEYKVSFNSDLPREKFQSSTNTGMRDIMRTCVIIYSRIAIMGSSDKI